jgi:hypothetical protein
MKKSVAALILCFIILSNGLFSSSLSILSIEDATMDQLVLMCNVRMLSTDGSKTDLQNRLLEVMNNEDGDQILDNDTPSSEITQDNKDKPIVSNPYILKIISAQTLSKTGDIEPLIVLEGSAVITFQMSEEDEPQKLSASKIVVDLAHKRLSALGNVSFESKSGSENESFQNIEGEIVSLNWGTNAINVAGGSISTTRDNSDGDSVTFTAYSEGLSYNSELDSFILKNGYVTSNPDTAYSSITAEKLALLPNGDMFLKNAYISIGRVPVLWLPYFYSPGATMVGNPSIGYESSRGLFVNTSFEIFGKYPSFDTTDRSSFSTLLSSNSEDTLYPTSSIYTSTDELTDLEAWALENSNYLTLMFDSYQYTPYRSESASVDTSDDNDDTQAFALGYATELNFFSDSLKLESATMASLTSDGVEGDITYSSDFPVFRYDGEVDVSYDTDNFGLELSLPYASDPKAKKAYSNRLSTFSLDALWNQDQTFPTTYTSDVSSYEWTLSSDLTLPTDYFGDYIQALEVSSLGATATYTWKKVNGSYSYNLTSYTLPSTTAEMTGQIFNYNLSGDKTEEEDDKTGPLPYLFTKQGFETLTFENLDTDDIFEYIDEVNLEKERLRLIEEEENKKVKIGEIDKLITSDTSTPSATGSYMSLDYSISEDYYDTSESITYDSSGDYSSSTDTKASVTSVDLNYLLDVKPSWITVNSGLSTTYNYKEKTYTTNKVSVETDNTVSLPFLGLSYYFNTDLYNYADSTDTSVTTTNESFEFTDDWVTKHAVALSKEYDIDEFSLTPTLSLQLPPLDLTLSPSLQFKGFGFTNNLSADLDIDGTFELDSITNSLSYKNGNFSSSLKTYYDFELIDSTDRTIDPLEVSGSLTYNNTDKNQKISQSVSYYGEYDSVEDYFDEIKTTYSNEYLTSVLNLTTDVDDDNVINLSYLKNTLTINDLEKIWWKNRAGINLDANATFNWNFRDEYSTYFQLETSLSFAIAEFLTCDFSITTSNHGFYNYYTDDGDFDFSELLFDLGRAFDFIGDGRSNTNFNLEDISLEFIHYMDDWDLHCKYTGTVVLSSYEYTWVPTITFYLQWKTIPELKIDESFTQTDDVWTLSE